MSVSKEDILNAVAEMSVMEVVELVEAMEGLMDGKGIQNPADFS